MVAVVKLMGSKNGAREIMVVQNPWSYRLTGLGPLTILLPVLLDWRCKAVMLLEGSEP